MAKLRRATALAEAPTGLKARAVLGNLAAWLHYESAHPANAQVQELRRQHEDDRLTADEAIREAYGLLDHIGALGEFESWLAGNGGCMAHWPIAEKRVEAV